MLPVLYTSAAGQTLSEQLNSNAEYGDSFQYTETEDYSAILEEYTENGYAAAAISEPVRISASDYSASEIGLEISEQQGKSGVKWTDDNEFTEWKFSVPESGLYSVRVEYLAADNGISAITRSIMIDGEYPFSESQNVSFYRLFKDEGGPIVNSIGDEVASDVVQCFEWQRQEIMDSDAAYDGAFRFYLNAGEHTLRMEYISGDMYISTIELFAPTELPTYAETEEIYRQKGYKAGSGKVYFEAESDAIVYKNSSTLRAITSGDPGCTPYAYGKAKVNAIGDTLWQGANSAITYKFSVDSDGLYAISMRLLMNFRDGIPSYRSIAIDGEIPFREFSAYKFSYDRSWRTEVIGDGNGEPYYVYLTAGEHTLTISVTQGEISPVTALMQDDSDLMSQMLLKIKMIIGQNPDTNYDYELDSQIPDLIPTIDTVISDMEKCMEELERISGRKQSKYYQLKSFVTQLEAMKEDPFSIPGKIDSIEEIITTYGSWLSEMQAHPLTLDFIEILSDPSQKTVSSSNVFERLYASAVNFILSFSKDYNNVSVTTVSDVEITDTISVWVSRGSDWCQIMKQMIDTGFTPETGIAVNLNVLPAGQLNSGGANALLLSITSGRAPDVATGVSSTSIGEFAMRNALVDLSCEPEFEEVKTRFKEEHFVPLTYQGGVYALPETQNFMCMIYRKDIFSRLGLYIPNTWQELYDRVIPVLNQNNMQFYVPLTNASYDMFLYQLGGEYYHDDHKTTALDSSAAYQAMLEFTNLFTVYGVPQTASFYNRFRSGEMPLGIVDYNTYMTVKSAAGDISGKWGLALIPGHTEEDGSINRSHSSLSAECCMIISQTKKKDEAWQFLNWWMSDETQLEYANRVESTLGESARWVSADWYAFTSVAWEADELEVIEQSFEYAKQAPVVLGGYYISRHITNALNRIVVSGINVRDSVETAVEDINRELQRRRETVS